LDQPAESWQPLRALERADFPARTQGGLGLRQGFPVAGLGPAIHAYPAVDRATSEDVDGRNESGHGAKGCLLF
jgi:hypothetical protein